MPSVPMQSAAAQTFLALVLGVRLTGFRGQSFSQDGVLQSAAFEKWHKAQTNSAEYHGIFIGMCALLGLGWYRRGEEPSTGTNLACALSAISSYLFAMGVVLGKSVGANPTGKGKNEQPHPLRLLGALGRYISMALMAYQGYKLSKMMPALRDDKDAKATPTQVTATPSDTIVKAEPTAAPSQCPYFMGAPRVKAAIELNLKVLNPVRYLNDYDYGKEFGMLNLDAVKEDLFKLLKDSQPWWPADYGHYGPFMIRLAWHSAGTYRTFDGRGGANTGNMRFAPLNSWPDNGNLDKARRLLWPIKQKYGKKLSWGDLMIFAGNCALEDMGFKPLGFAGGRVDIWQPEEDIYWGSEAAWLADERHKGGKSAGLEKPLGADQMGLIYVNPQGPGGNPDPLESAKYIRETFGRMAMNDEETVALIAGGHTFGKAHGAADPDKHVGPEPEAAPLHAQGFGWDNKFGSGKGVHSITSGLEGAWTTSPTKWDHGYFENLFKYEWVKTKSPAGATQWIPKDDSAKNTVPDAHDPKLKHAPVMFTTDLALKMDPIYKPISERFLKNPDQFKNAFAEAWYKLTHRDMGPVERCLGKLVPPARIWQDPVPKATGKLITLPECQDLKGKILQSGISIASLVRTAWASASTYRCTDFRGGANGARIRLAPQKDWEVNSPKELAQTLEKLGKIRPQNVSLADMIVLGGCAAIEAAAKKGGSSVQVPFTPGRMDASADETDAISFAVLEPTADGFRNHKSTAHQLVDRAHMLTLTPPEMTVLVGGMRALNANTAQSQDGVFTKQPETLTNDFFVNLLDVSTTWKPSKAPGSLYEGCDPSGKVKWTASEADLVFGSNSELRAIAEYYACSDSKQAFVQDFAAAWVKVMNLDRF